VVGIVNKPSRLEKLNEIGFLDGIDSSCEDWIDQVHEVFGPFGPDVVVELSGNLTAFQNALNIVRPGDALLLAVFTLAMPQT
jgi:threonine dehydrogenase-like Zn-dependent dehydrogenase